MADDAPFPFVQFEFAHPLGPADGRYLRRSAPADPPQWVIVLGTLGAQQRRLLSDRRRRRGGPVTEVDGAAAVPTVRATLIHAERLASASEAEPWLDSMRSDDAARTAEVDAALRELNGVIRAHRAAAADPYAREVSAAGATVGRIGNGRGDQVADGRYEAAFELPAEVRRRPSRRTEALAPQERLAAVLGGNDSVMAAEELVLRARLDVDARRPREAALQARIALEALLTELRARQAGGPDPLTELLGELDADRAAVGDAANAALRGDPPAELNAAVAEAVARMDRALRHARV